MVQFEKFARLSWKSEVLGEFDFIEVISRAGPNQQGFPALKKKLLPFNSSFFFVTYEIVT